MSKASRTILIDADIFAFAASSATEGVYRFNGPDADPCVDENLDEALRVAVGFVEDVANKLQATRVIVCLTDQHNFRKDVCASYKANRAGVRKPSTLGQVKAHFAATYETYQRPGLEADDCMGILATHKTLITGERIIVSSDKDLQGIPGLLFNPKKDDKPRRISKLDADRYFLSQVLTGDPTDGYTGCPGIGAKSPFVAAVLAAGSLKEAWEHVLAGYAKKGLGVEDAVLQARMARILRAEDWDFAKKAPRLWTPPA